MIFAPETSRKYRAMLGEDVDHSEVQEKTEPAPDNGGKELAAAAAAATVAAADEDDDFEKAKQEASFL